VQFAITDTFIRHFDSLGDILLSELLEQLNWCISQGNCGRRFKCVNGDLVFNIRHYRSPVIHLENCLFIYELLEHEQISLSGVQCFNNLIRMLEEQLSQQEWCIISELAQSILSSSFGVHVVSLYCITVMFYTLKLAMLTLKLKRYASGWQSWK
jgi:hypothetical protein